LILIALSCADDRDPFQEVKRNQGLYDELVGNFLMDQNKKHFRAILDDGEYSDEVSILYFFYLFIIF
jgi:hypothetical protein